MTDQKQIPAFFIVVIVIILFFVLLFYRPAAPSTSKNLEAFEPVPSKEITPSPESDPVITTWESYSNTQYNFALSVPGDWKMQDYSAAYPTGGTRIAFSPDTLPCDTCTYFHDGYFSIKIFNQKTDPDSYALFMQQKQKLGKDANYREVSVGKKKGVFFANTITVENNTWVYELSLDKDKGNGNIAESKIFQKAFSTFQFTDLFTN